MNGKVVRVTVVAVVLLAASFVGYLFVNQWLSLRALNAENAALRGRIEQLRKDNDEKAEDIKQSSSDSFIERMARELLGWVKPGEIKIVDKNEG